MQQRQKGITKQNDVKEDVIYIKSGGVKDVLPLGSVQA